MVKFKLPKQKNLYINEDGRPKTLAYVGKKLFSGYFGDTERTTQTLEEYWNYYLSESNVFASISITAFNTVMVGYNLISDDEDAKKIIKDFCDKNYFLSSLLENVTYSLIFGDSFTELIYNKANYPVSMKISNPKNMIINTDNYGRIISYQQIINGNKLDEIDPIYIAHYKVFNRPDSPYGISLIEPSKNTIKRKMRTDKAIANALWRHGFRKWIITVGNKEFPQIPPDSVMRNLEKKFEDINERNEFVIPHLLKIEPTDEKGVQGIEEYFNYFQSQLVTGMLTLEEALGMGRGILHPDTEILVKGKGFIPISDVKDDDIIMTYNNNTNTLEWGNNLKTWEYDLDEELFSIEAQTFNLLCTQDHRVLYRGQHKDSFEICQAKDLPSRFEMIVGGMNWIGNDIKFERIPSAPRLYGNRFISGKVIGEYKEKLIPMDIWLKFLGYYLSEGSTSKDKYGSYTVSIKQLKPNGLDKIYNDIKDMPFKLHKRKDYIKIHDKQLGQYLYNFGKSHERYIPKHIKELPKEKLSIIYESLMYGDGSGNNYFTSSKQLADDVQEIILKLGYGSSIHVNDNVGKEIIINDYTVHSNHIQYTVTKNEKNLTPEISIKDSSGHKDMHKLVKYKGKAYCVTVENGLILTRLNGKCVITGNSTEACYDSSTETLTIDGWKLYSELTNDDKIATYNPNTNKLEYHKPLEDTKNHIYNHDGPMIHFKSEKIDILVTPEHRMWVNKNPIQAKEEWKFVTAEEIYKSKSNWAVKLKYNSENDIEIKQEDINFMKLVGYLVSKGNIDKEQTVIRVSQEKEGYLEKIREILESAPYEFKESYSDENGYEWRSTNKDLYKLMSKFGKNYYDRHLTRDILNSHSELLKYLLFALIDSGGIFNKHSYEYTTTSKQLSDDIQEIATKCGYESQIIYSEDKQENETGTWRVIIDLDTKDYSIITPSMCKKIYYKGVVHCLNVPNHIYFTRRNGKIAIQGNTANVKSIMFERMIRAFQLRISETVEKEIFDRILVPRGFKPGAVKIKFNSVTEQDEALKAKWLAQLLSAFKQDTELPFTIDEIRSMFGFSPKGA